MAERGFWRVSHDSRKLLSSEIPIPRADLRRGVNNMNSHREYATTRLQERIQSELHSQQASFDAITEGIAAGHGEEAAIRLAYFASPRDALAELRQLRKWIAANLEGASSALHESHLCFLAEITLDLGSAVADWNLRNRARHGAAVVSSVEATTEIEANLELIDTFEAQVPAVAERVLSQRRQEDLSRLVAEAVAQPDVEAHKLSGSSLGQYLRNMLEEIRSSNLLSISGLRLAGLNRTELGNDYAACLKYTLYLGASFVTTNPVLVNAAWSASPDHWTPIMQDIVALNAGADGDELARLATLEVVLANMRMLRPLFLLTEGRMGSVSLQVNPKCHNDAHKMIADARDIYSDLGGRLSDGVPNVVFKLPATRAGLEACRALTMEGIGVNITLNFGVFQLLRFAEVIREGQAIVSVLSEMNGRLAAPVRDELLAALPLLTRDGVFEADVREAAAWSGVAVVKKLHRLLGEHGYDTPRIKPLVASLRVYKEGAGYDRLPSPCPDLTETLGVSIITVFPDVRRAFDELSLSPLDPVSVDREVPPHVLDVLTHSEIFKQAYYVSDPRWAPCEDQRFRPDRLLRLEDEAEVAAWAPMSNTLRQFAASYDHFVQQLQEIRLHS
jgi:transaldolase